MTAADIYFSSVKLLLHGDGADSATTFTDSSDGSNVISRYGGNESLSTAIKKFGTSSIHLPSQSSYLTAPASSDWAFGSGDFTVEGWVRVDNFGSGSCVVCGTYDGTSGWYLAFTGTQLTFYANPSIGGFSGSVSAATGSFYHVAACRSAGILRLFFGGNQVGTSFTYGHDLPWVQPLRIGVASLGNNHLVGYIDDLRVTKGVARYTGSSFPIQTEAFPDIDYIHIAASLLAPAPNVTASMTVVVEHINAALTAPSPSVWASSGALLTLAAPSPTVQSAAGPHLALTAPSPLVTSRAHDSTGENAITSAAPSPTLSAYAGANAAPTAPRPTLAATGTVVIMASASLSAPSPTLSATTTVSGMMSATVRAPSPNLVGYGGAVCSVSVTGRPTVQATVTTGSIASIAVTCPLFQLEASATAQNHASINVIAPSPRMGTTVQAWITAPSARLTAIGSAVITATYEAYAVNLNHTARPGVEPVDETTRYTNFPFTHVIRHKGSYYGANSTGLYLLEGTTDDTAPITWAVKTAMTDFKSPQRKTVASAYFGGRLGPADTITLHAGEGAQTQPYSYTTPRGALAQNYRQAFGKGIKSHRYYALAASGSGEMALDNIDLDVHNLTRRI